MKLFHNFYTIGGMKQHFLSTCPALPEELVFSSPPACPLPPKENVLPIRVTAGEMTVEGFGYH